MNSIVKDLAEVSSDAAAAGRETRDIAWAFLLQLAHDGNDEAKTAINDLRGVGKRRKNRATATIGDTFHSKKTKG
jgi:hypothetical protein